MSGPTSHVTRIELQLHDVNQLFHTLDPSPFRERSLDAEAEAFIVNWALGLRHKQDLELVIHLPQPPSDPDLAAQVQTAVHSHFQYLAEVKQREFQQLMARGRTSLLIGVGFLGLCVLLGNTLASGGSPVLSFARESLLIGGWVAMWRPIEIFLYDWWEVRRQRRDFELLGRMPVRLAGTK